MFIPIIIFIHAEIIKKIILKNISFLFEFILKCFKFNLSKFCQNHEYNMKVIL